MKNLRQNTRYRNAAQRRALDRFAAEKASPISKDKKSKFDKWLERLSFISQFGLFLFTVATIFYTVIPLYQKALLDEAIAQKEIELRNSTAAYEKTYSHLRAAIVLDFVRNATPQCSGIMPPSSLFPSIENITSAKQSVAESIADYQLSINVHSCLVQLSERLASMNDLHSDDKKTFTNRIEALGTEIDFMHKKALQDSIDVQANKPSLDTIQPLHFTAKMLNFLKDKISPEEYQQQIHLAQIRALQTYLDKKKGDVAQNYSHEVVNKIKTLLLINWSNQSKS